MKKKKVKMISAEEFDKIFDEGKEDILKYFDTKNVRTMYPSEQETNFGLPTKDLNRLDRISKRIGVSKHRLVQTWLLEKIKEVEKLTFL